MAQGAYNNLAVPYVIYTSPAAHYTNSAGGRAGRWNGCLHNGIITANTTGTMKAIDRNGKIAVLGATFNGINDVIKHAVSGKAKDGVYVGEDPDGVSVFRRRGLRQENRRFWNFMFAENREDMQQRLAALKKARVTKANYNKLSEQFAPMAYWGGDSNDKVRLVEK